VAERAAAEVRLPDDRRLEFEGCANIRDLGGLPGEDGRVVRRGLLFRSMTPEHMTPADVARARELGIALVIDLRGRRFKTSGALGEHPARRVTVGSRRSWRWDQEARIAFQNAAPETALPQVMDRLGRTFAAAVTHIARAEGPVLYHCRLGKDRTGVLSALLLKVLGVSDADVIDDYLQSADELERVRALLRQAGEPVTPPEDATRLVREPPHREAMVALLARLEAEGGAYAFLRAQGVTRRDLLALKAKALGD